MHPPADPWGPLDPEPQPYPPLYPPTTQTPGLPPPPPVYGRASAPVPLPALRENTAELPNLPMTVLRAPGRRPSKEVSWEKTKNSSLRRLADGWGFTAAGLFIAFIGWGLWAAAGRGSSQSSLPGLVIMLAAGAAVFVIARSVGYVVVEKVRRRPRLHARWTHFTTGLFLTVAGVAYFISTRWLIDSGDWVRDGLNWLGDLVQRGR